MKPAAFYLGNWVIRSLDSCQSRNHPTLFQFIMFDGVARFLLFTILPAAFIGAVPAAFVRSFSWTVLGQLLLVTGSFLTLAIVMPYAVKPRRSLVLAALGQGCPQQQTQWKRSIGALDEPTWSTAPSSAVLLSKVLLIRVKRPTLVSEGPLDPVGTVEVRDKKV